MSAVVHLRLWKYWNVRKGGDRVEVTLYYTPDEVASFMRVDERTVRNMANRGEIPGARQFGKQWRFDREKLEAHLGRDLPEPQRSSEA